VRCNSGGWRPRVLFAVKNATATGTCHDGTMARCHHDATIRCCGGKIHETQARTDAVIDPFHVLLNGELVDGAEDGRSLGIDEGNRVHCDRVRACAVMKR
jgi:hypothetical protein